MQLLECHAQVTRDREDVFLYIVGDALDERFAKRLVEKAQQVGNARVDVQYVEDDNMHLYYQAADAAILPTSLSVNSGSAMLSLSFGVPVMIPHRGTFIEMRETVGADWVHTFDGGIRASVLDRTFDLAKPATLPDLDKHHDWRNIARTTYDAFVEAATA
ncbi:hypothetical protein ASF87_00200 [Microbacterium sp. Leaf161]|nr:hypothetical protein ASF87_00200 [Microbacterium sp. Leaf161]